MSRPLNALSCAVEVDGRRLADTAEDYTANVPTVLAGLSLRWGRTGTAEQPQTATCAFTVRDRNGGAEFLELLHVGRPVSLWAASDLASGGDPIDVAVDGSMSDWSIPTADRVAVWGGHANYDSFGADDRHLQIVQTAYAPYWCRVHLPVAPFSSSTTAWDDIPAAWPGQQWRIRLGVTAGRSVAVNVQACILAWPNQRENAYYFGPMTHLPVAALRNVELDLVIPDDAPRGWLGVLLDFHQATWEEIAGSWADQLGQWMYWPTVVLDNFQVLAPALVRRDVLAFSGRITDLHAAPHGHGGVQVDVTAADSSADLANVYVGDVAWNAERLDLRAQRIVALSGVDVHLDVDAHPAGARITWRDVDSQPVWGLLTELADSADAVLWCAEHATRDAYLWMEDTSARASLAQLTYDSTVQLVIIEQDTVVPGGRGVVLSACDLDRAAQWVSDVGDVITRVDLTWQEQTTDDQGLPAPTERHILRVDGDAELDYGQRRAGYTTQLADPDYADDVAGRVLSRSRSANWHIDSVVWDTRLPQSFTDAHRTSALNLLDGTRRIGMALTVTDLPDVAPGGPLTRYHVEGGTWSYQRGRWSFDMALSPTSATGRSVTWRELDPAWPWRDMDARPATVITWWDMYGVGAQNLSRTWEQLTGAWRDQTGAWTDYWGPRDAARKAA